MGVQDLFANGGGSRGGGRPNIVFIITDQERSLQHWPTNFARDNLPAMTRLMRNGMTFDRAFTNACMCSPSRATLLTSQFPSRHGVTRTGSPEPQFALPTDMPNLATVLRRAGYRCEWRGKWHLGGGDRGPADYGFDGWVAPDAGNYLTPNDSLGGGTPDNDGRFLEEILSFLDEYHERKQQQPFCLVASFVNPHDVYMAQHEINTSLGYTTDDFHRMTVPLPTNLNEDLTLNNKPRAQVQLSWQRVPFHHSHQEYVNFYAYLHTIVDGQIMQLLDRLDEHGLTNDTLIVRLSDHGEQALSHGLVEKFFNAYEESIHIPLVFSNPVAFPGPVRTDALASLLDVVPTVASLLSVSDEFRDCFSGKDLTPILENRTPPLPSSSSSVQQRRSGVQSVQSVQSLVHFTYDDIPAAGDDAPSTIRCVRTARYKYAVYFNPDGTDADWELYDLRDDPDENDNVAGNPSYAGVQRTLETKLRTTMEEMGTTPVGFRWPPRETGRSRGTACWGGSSSCSRKGERAGKYSSSLSEGGTSSGRAGVSWLPSIIVCFVCARLYHQRGVAVAWRKATRQKANGFD